MPVYNFKLCLVYKVNNSTLRYWRFTDFVLTALPFAIEETQVGLDALALKIFRCWINFLLVNELLPIARAISCVIVTLRCFETVFLREFTNVFVGCSTPIGCTGEYNIPKAIQ